MPEETTPAVEQGTGTPIDQIPTDFKGYGRWRSTGELPAAKEEKTEKPPATAAESAPANGEPETQVKTAPESEPDDSQETDGFSPEESQPSRPSSRQRRIDKLTRENAELQRLLAEARTQQGAEARTAPPPAPPVEAPAVPGRPVLKDFQTLEEYTEALTEWKLNQREAAQRAENEKRSAEAAAKALQDNWAAKDAAAAKAHPDYRELMDATEIPEGPGVLAARQALLEEDNGAEILYWLASRPAELKRVAALPPMKAVIEIGKLAAALASPSSPENHKRQVTSAPRPPAPISHGTVRTAENIYDDQTARDFKRWSKAREAQLRE
jgi:hypothetical protein